MNPGAWMELVAPSADDLCRELEQWANAGFLAGLASVIPENPKAGPGGAPMDDAVQAEKAGAPCWPAEHVTAMARTHIGFVRTDGREEVARRHCYLQALLIEAGQRQKAAWVRRRAAEKAGATVQFAATFVILLGAMASFPSWWAVAGLGLWTAGWALARNRVKALDRKMYLATRAEKRPEDYLPWIPGRAAARAMAAEEVGRDSSRVFSVRLA